MSSPNLDENLVRESLECAICKDFFNEPKQLVCGHTFCRNCIDRLDKIPHANRHIDYGEDLYPFHIQFAVQCPQCRDLCILPHSGLNTNYVVKEMVEKFRDIGFSQNRSSSEENNSKISCETCKRQTLIEEMFLCRTCTRGQKENKKIFLCSLCIVIRGHKDHEIIICTDLACKQDRTLAKNKVCENEVKAHSHVQEMKTISNSVIQHFDKLCKQIISHANYFKTLQIHCMDVGTTQTKQELESKVLESEALANRIDQAKSQLEKVILDNIRCFSAISSSIERFNPLPTEQNIEASSRVNLIDFDSIPSTSSAAELISTLISPNRFTYNNDELDKKRRPPARRKSRRVGTNVATDDNAAISPIVLD